ncbi:MULTISPECIES: hypothetical protein [unclassified Afipia]|uniref:hypothetical protein n=1 Tax=unclassified Afipia TaxID=2642050 RepID=UPI001FCA8971|nr:MULTISPECIES: hypothetical protein [unclassified Afipia]
MLRRKSIALSLISLTMLSSGLVLGQTTQATTPSTQNTQADKPTDAAAQATGTIPAQSEPVTVAPAQPAEATPAPAPAPLSPAEQKAADNKAALDALLGEAMALKASYENSRRGRSKAPVSLSAFRSMGLRLQMAAAADPANAQALEMANAMRMIQYGILQPSVQIAAVANRELYAHEMGQRMRDDGMKVEASGRGNSTVRFVSPQMTRQMAMQLVETAKIPEQARALQFRRVVFSSGRRSWTYDVARGRLR